MNHNETPLSILLAIFGIGDDPNINMGGAPGGDMSFDELFPPDEGFNFADNGIGNQPNPPVEPQIPQVPSDDFFLKGSNSVYKTREEALKGIDEKDSLIQQLRNTVVAMTGVDPVTRRPIGSPQPAPQGPVSYNEKPEAYFEDLKNAVTRNDPNAYREAQQRLIMDTLAPVAPLIQSFAKQQALEKMSNDIKDFRPFYGSDQYNAVLKENPKLAQAIEMAESNVGLSQDLPDLYKLAYAYGQYKRLPDLVKTAQTAAPSQPNPSTVRPTTAPSTIPPALQDERVSQTLSTPEGRKAIIEAAKARGLDKLGF
jgi:hypothetical protein